MRTELMWFGKDSKQYLASDLADHNIDRIVIGKNCHVGENVLLQGFNQGKLNLIVGDNVRIGHNVKIISGGTVAIADGVTLHNNVSILGNGDCFIGKDSWVAQYTSLDCEGGLIIGEQCCIGFSCQIWSHVKRAPFLPMSKFHKIAKTIIGNRVWLMGGLITVSPGVHIANDTIVLSNSVVSHSTESKKVYAGIPAIVKEGMEWDYVDTIQSA